MIIEANRQHSTKTYVYQYGLEVLLLLYIGIRNGEGLALKWKNVDIENEQIYIESSISRIKDSSGKRYNKEVSPKTKKSTRKVYLAPQAIECIKNTQERN
ncbi:MAG TPA: hypothetical protein DCP51_02180 [Clostridiales bacterium]|nr:hypothetical protein [Clostridiales bacterium]